MIEFFSAAGGLFALLAFVHFFGDWLFQSQYEALHKSKNAKIRARHCLIYTLFFVPVLYFAGVTNWIFAISLVVLWGSHFIIDTYIPVVLWAKYLRRIPDLQASALKGQSEDGTVSWGIDLETQFQRLWYQPVYPILFIMVDQILHLTFLWPIVLLILL